LLSFGAECFVLQFVSKNIKIKIHINIILPVLLYACETWSLTLREERSYKSVLKKIFGPRREEVRGEWRKLHNEELNDLYSSQNIVWVIKSRRIGWVGNVVRIGESSMQGFVGEI
jgi:hypothetical protein